MLVAALFGCGPPQAVTLRVWVAWPGASAAEVERAVTVPLENGLVQLPGARALIGESWSGLSRVTVTVTEATALSRVLHGVGLPEGARVPWAESVPAERSLWILPAGARGGDLEGAFGLGAAGSDTRSPPVVEVILPSVGDLPEIGVDEVLESADAWLDRPSPTGTLRSHALTIRTLPPRSSASWNGAPVEVWTVGKPAAEVARYWADHPVGAVPWPAREARRVETWRAGEASSVEAALRAAGATDVLVVTGRPLPGQAPESGRTEVIGWWPGRVPRGVAGSPISETVAVVRAEVGAPPPRTTWDVEVDPDRAERLGLAPHEVAAVVRAATVGARVPTRDGTLVELRVGEVGSVEAIAELPVADGVRVRDVATVRSVEEPRVRLRYDRAPAGLVDGVIPDGLEVVARVPRALVGSGW